MRLNNRPRMNVNRSNETFIRMTSSFARFAHSRPALVQQEAFGFMEQGEDEETPLEINVD